MILSNDLKNDYHSLNKFLLHLWAIHISAPAFSWTFQKHLVLQPFWIIKTMIHILRYALSSSNMDSQLKTLNRNEEMRKERPLLWNWPTNWIFRWNNNCVAIKKLNWYKCHSNVRHSILFLSYFSAHRFNVICWFADMRHLKTITSKWKSKVQMNEMAWIIQLKNNFYVFLFLSVSEELSGYCAHAQRPVWYFFLVFIILLIVWFVPFVWIFFVVYKQMLKIDANKW